MTHRSYLFVPGDRPERFPKALASGAGAVILDLEDAVAPDAKDAARRDVAAWLASGPVADVHVRINASGTPWFDDDLQMCAD
ncbi:MAG: CoA ester lyase, partial [Burkholderiales bacterium]